MEQRIQFGWSNARRTVRNWFCDLIDRTGCRRAAYRDPETSDRAKRIDDHCPNQVCEAISIGRHGTPGPVAPSEKLYRILIAPHQVDLSSEAILLTAVSHTEVMGMSMLRDQASAEEFKRVANELLNGDPKRSVYGVSEIVCDEIRKLKSAVAEPRRNKEDRHFIALDTDLPSLPNHIDVFSTFPRPAKSDKDPSSKAVWRRERARLFALAKANVIKVDAFERLASNV